MIHQLKNRNFYIVMAVDWVIFTVSLTLAYMARLGFAIPPEYRDSMLAVLPWVLAVKTVVFFVMGAYRGMWRYTSIHDAIGICKAGLLSSLIIIAGLTYVNRFKGYPRSVFVTDFVFASFLACGLRGAIRVAARRRGIGSGAAEHEPTHRTRLLIVGAGDAAEKIIREIQDNRALPYAAVCCLDDSPGKFGRSLLGVPVRGPIEKLPLHMEQYRADEILIAIPSAPGETMRRIVALCEQTGARFRTLPPLAGLLDGRVSVSDLRRVHFEDLLGRPPVHLRADTIGHYLAGRTVCVTGAGGSIGSELCRQVARFRPAAMLLTDSSEFNLYRIETEMANLQDGPGLVSALARVQDRALMAKFFGKHRPHVVFHAAACKHVPMVELNPWEGVRNNVLGSQVVMDLAEQYGADRFVLVSSDKAVCPTNVMGATKRAAEILLQSRPPSSTRFMAVRFGNVVGSSGSVTPLFESQIRAGGPVTVTHPEITRYFMTIPEACQLILQAGALGEGGEIFILEMGTPVKIDSMARDMIRLSGKEPDRDIRIVYTGLRPGEKLHEELITHAERIVPTTYEKIMVLKRGMQSADPQPEIAALLDAAENHASLRIKAALKRMIPEYIPSDVDAVV
ncbi:MAG: polysaccharide biosynthesis protein [Planctomycetes bacterium]|nr:polysaccharide biosynthesis protein [Planctomycetota bacterium]MBM4144511.1 polysaccharide biosynthesis protein [Lentisphaerota bacterium]